MSNDDKRTHKRYGVHAGNAEITSVFGAGSKPAERARIVNWSRGGFLLKVASPRRRFVVLSRPPCLHTTDTVSCVLRLPPLYGDVEVQAEVRHVARVPEEPDTLYVGLAFNELTTPDRIDTLARLLEPQSQRLGRVSARAERQTSQRQTSQRQSKRVQRQSQRLGASTDDASTPAQSSQRVRKSQRVAAQPGANSSGRLPATPSRRLPAQSASGRLAPASASQRQRAPRTSGRVPAAE